MMRQVPNPCLLHHGDSPGGATRPTLWRMLWISMQSSRCRGNPRWCQHEHWITGSVTDPASVDSVMESDDDSSIQNRKPRWKGSYSSQSSTLPWRAYHQFWGRREKLHLHFSRSRCAWAVMTPWRTWELSPHPPCTCMHFLGGIYLNSRI